MTSKTTNASSSARTKYISERNKLNTKKNAFIAIDIMAEGNNQAFEILTDFIAHGDKVFNDFVRRIDDMNIRGEQIDILHKIAGCDLQEMIRMVGSEPDIVCSYINANWNRAHIEWAIPEGAHENAHK